MAKRTAGKDLNHENWDAEEESEEAGTFKVASEDVIKQRDIKKARRRNPTPSSSLTDAGAAAEGTGASGGAFKGFSFGAQASGSRDKLFSFGSTSTPSLFGAPSSSSKQEPKGSASATSTSSSTSMASSSRRCDDDGNDDDGNDVVGKESAASKKNGDEKSGGSTNAEYTANLRALNEGLLEWVTKHVDKNPYCILTPVFDDYKRHLAELEKERDSQRGATSKEGVESNQNGAKKAASIQLSTPLNSSGGQLSSPLKFNASGSTFGGFGTISSSAQSSSGADKILGSTSDRETGPSKDPPTSTSPFSGMKFGSGSAGLKFGESTASAGGFKFGAGGLGSMAATTSSFSFFSSSSSSIPAASSATTTTTTAASGMFSAGFFTSSSSSTAPASSSGSSLFSFKPATTAGLSFGTSGPPPVLFGGAALRSTASATSQVGGTGEEDNEEYEPPKPELIDIKEEGAFYSVRCKLFYMKGSSWADRGLGNLHMKKAGEDDSKTQLIIRTDNASGSILLNIFLPKDMPVKKLNPTNVSIVCVPNPPIPGDSDTKAGKTLLIKVKAATDADELLKHLNDNTPK